MNEIVWLGPMGKDDTSQRAREIARYSLAPVCEEHGFALYYPQTLEAENWLDELLRRIRSARGVICDLSDSRCNVYFEFGFAYALGLPKILFCRSGTDIHTDLKNIQYHTYSTMDEVELVIRKWLKTLSQEYNLSQVTNTLPHPFRVLEGDGEHEYVYDVRHHRKPFILDVVDDTPLTLESIAASQADVGKLLIEIHDLQKKIAVKTYRPFFSGDLFSYMQHTPLRDESGTYFGARVHVRYTNYYTFVATHYPFQALDDACELSLISPMSASLLRENIAEQMRLSLWPFARPLTAMVFLVAEWDGIKRLYFQRRNVQNNFHARYLIQATAGGMMHPSRIFDQHGSSSYSPEIAFLHELCEESGISAQVGSVKILGLVQETQWQECAFVGYVVAGKTQLDERKLPIDSFESEGFEYVQLQPHYITTYLRNKAQGGKDLSPLTLAALSLLLVHEFGLHTMVRIFKDALA